MTEKMQTLFSMSDMFKENEEKINKVKALLDQKRELDAQLDTAIGVLPLELMTILGNGHADIQGQMQTQPEVAVAVAPIATNRRVSFADLDVQVMQLIKQHGPLTSKQIREKTGLDTPRIAQSLNRIKTKIRKVPFDKSKGLSNINTAYVVK